MYRVAKHIAKTSEMKHGYWNIVREVNGDERCRLAATRESYQRLEPSACVAYAGVGDLEPRLVGLVGIAANRRHRGLDLVEPTNFSNPPKHRQLDVERRAWRTSLVKPEKCTDSRSSFRYGSDLKHTCWNRVDSIRAGAGAIECMGNRRRHGGHDDRKTLVPRSHGLAVR